MIETDDTAPAFTAPVANGAIDSFSLTTALEDGPIVLAFFPGAFTSVCTTELCTFRDRLSEFESVNARVFGVSRDSPFTLNEFRDKHDLSFGLLSDFNGEIVEAFGITTAFTDIGLENLAKRAVYVIDSDGTVSYSWVSDDPSVEPDYDEVREAAAAAA